MSRPFSTLDLRPVPGMAGLSITVGATAVVIAGSANQIDPIQAPYVLVEFAMNGNGLRYRHDGVDPTDSVGIARGASSQEFMSTYRYNQLRLIRSGGSDSNMIVLPLTI
jgi:hypothetical protein